MCGDQGDSIEDHMHHDGNTYKALHKLQRVSLFVVKFDCNIRNPKHDMVIQDRSLDGIWASVSVGPVCSKRP